MSVKKLQRWLLPSVAVKDRLKLPRKPGCYYIFRDGELLYVGAAKSGLRQRWSNHHKLKYLRSDDKIHYWVMPSYEVSKQEAADIDEFDKPPLNKRRERVDAKGHTLREQADIVVRIILAALIVWKLWEMGILNLVR
jgi:hypothetical protein